MALNIPAGITSGTIVVNGSADLPTSPTPGTRVYRLDVNKSFEWNGGKWVSRADTADVVIGNFVSQAGDTYTNDRMLIQSGFIDVPVSGGKGSTSLTYPSPYRMAPVVIAQGRTGAVPIVVTAVNTSFAATDLYVWNDAPGTTTRGISWAAIGLAP